MKTKNWLILLITASCFLSCSVDDESENNIPNTAVVSTNGLNSGEYMCESGDPNIVGARCNDGSKSDATGQGACSRHGGVNYWICQ